MDVINIEIPILNFLFNFSYNPNLNIISSHIGAKIQVAINSIIISKILDGPITIVLFISIKVIICSSIILKNNDRKNILNKNLILILLIFSFSFTLSLSLFFKLSITEIPINVIKTINIILDI